MGITVGKGHLGIAGGVDPGGRKAGPWENVRTLNETHKIKKTEYTIKLTSWNWHVDIENFIFYL